MADAIGPGALLIEPGSGNSHKARLLLEHLLDPVGYVPVDISREHMTRWVAQLAADFPGLYIVPTAGDFCADFDVPPVPGARRRVVFFPGSTIGNFTPDEAAEWLSRMARIAGPDGGLLIGVDLKKDVATMEAAYNDRAGVTRAFNMNMLSRLKNDLGADVRPERFEHRAFYNTDLSRIEMHLVSTEQQTIRLDHTEIELKPGETIHTENSYKYDLEQFAAIAAQSGWHRAAYWTDDEMLFSVQYFEATPAPSSA
jgi:dimethylhistidine N-methyltransferase